MTWTKVLLVDDDEDVAAALGAALRLDGFEVTIAGSSDAAMEAFESFQPDAVVLDVMLPGRSGLDICRALRRRSPVPIVMISGLDGEGDVVEGLEAGADDYLVKPFGMPELIAVIRAALRRGPPRGEHEGQRILQVGDVHIDSASGRAWLGGRLLELSAVEFELLRVLLEHAGKNVTRAELVSGVWGLDQTVSRKTVDARVRRLRVKLGPERRIVTIRGVGFRYELPPGSGTASTGEQ